MTLRDTPAFRLLRSVCALLLLATTAAAAEPTRLAVIAERGREDVIALVVAKLSTVPGIVLVEREKIAEILKERYLSPAALTAEDALKVGRLMDAQGVIIFRMIGSGKEVVPNVTLISVASGAILASVNVEADPVAAADRVSYEVSCAVPKFALKPSEIVKLSVVNFRSLRNASDIERPLTRLFAAFLPVYPDLLVLERERLPQLAMEQAFAPNQSAFWNGSYLVSGTVEGRIDSRTGVIAKVEVVPPKGGKGVVLTVEGDRTKLEELAHKCAEAVAAHFRQTRNPLAKDWDNKLEAERFLREAELGWRTNNAPLASSSAIAAWSLGLRTPRIAEILMMLTFDKLLGKESSQKSRMTHYNSGQKAVNRLYPFVNIASDFKSNHYWRGNPDFWFSDDLDRIDDLLGYYRVFLKAAQSDPELAKVNDSLIVPLGAQVLMIASWPQFLIHRDLERDQYQARVAQMGAELRVFCAELLASNISPDHRSEVLTIQAAMLPFWSSEGGLTETAIRKTMDSSRGLENFPESAAKHYGLILGFFLAHAYVGPQLSQPFLDMKDGLLQSPEAEDRLLGQFIRFRTTPLKGDDVSDRERALREFFQTMAEITPNGRLEPKALGLYLQGAMMIFDRDDWTKKWIQGTRKIEGSREIKVPLPEVLADEVGAKYRLFFFQHWKSGSDLALRYSPFENYGNGPFIEVDREGKLRPGQDVASIKEYFSPYVAMLREESRKSDPAQDKLKILNMVTSRPLKYFPELFPESDQAEPVLAAAPKASREPIVARLKWSSRTEIERLLGQPLERSSSEILRTDRTDEIAVLGSGSKDSYFLFRISLPGFEAKSEVLPWRHFVNEGGFAAPHGMIENKRYRFFFGADSSFLKQDLTTGAWRRFESIGAVSGFEKDGFFYFASQKEFMRFDPVSDHLDILASLARTPAASPLDDSGFLDLSLKQNEKGDILVAGHSRERSIPSACYIFYPATGQWEALPPASLGKPSEENRFARFTSGQLVLWNADPNQSGRTRPKAYPVTLEGESRSGFSRDEKVIPAGDGYVLFGGDSRSVSGINLWHVSRQDIDDYNQRSAVAPVQ